MFMPPHDFQVILEVAFTGAEEPQARYVQDRQHTGTRLYTFSPAQEWDINELAPIGPQRQPQRASFAGTIWRNHFESHPVTHPGKRKPIADAVATVHRVVRFQRFAPQAEPLPQLTYVLFGKGEELFLAHVITRPPDFDQVLAVRVGDRQFSDEELGQGVLVTIPDRANAIPNRIREGEQVVGRVQKAGPGTPATVDLHLDAGVEFYFETEDLTGQM
jgi:hypothetical protein